MTFNKNTIEGKWNEIKGDLHKAWGNLTDDELDKTKGDLKSIAGLLQQKYGQAQDSYHTRISEIFSRFDVKLEEKLEAVKESLKSKN